MTTYLIASNEMMCRILARRMEGQDIPLPVRWHCPEWLTDGAVESASVHTIDNPDEAEPLPHGAVDLVLVDCSTADDPHDLLDRVHARLAPRRWLVLSDALDDALMTRAARLGAAGCLAVPAPVDLVCAAAALVWAGGQCFPRSALTMLSARSPSSAQSPQSAQSSQQPATAAGTASTPMPPPYPQVYPDGSTAIG
ncbi:MAG: response regulator transcription factor [Cupriavidus sp.]|nr:response regulator transcription factor [Cupriavidus sp.]